MMRFVLEGTWSGYTTSQSRVVHREIVDEIRAKSLSKLRLIRYTDGTCLYLDLRQCAPREKVPEITAYSSLIREAERAGVAEYAVRSPACGG